MQRDDFSDSSPPSITPTTLIRAVPDQVSTQVGGEAVILDMESGRYYGLGGVGSRVWQLLQQTTTRSDIVNVLLEEFDVERERCEQDVETLIRDLFDRGLVDIVDGGESG